MYSLREDVKKNWKCALGAAVLAPAGFVAFLAIITVFDFILATVPFLSIVLAGLLSLLLIFIIWLGIYCHCVDSHNKGVQ